MNPDASRRRWHVRLTPFSSERWLRRTLFRRLALNTLLSGLLAAGFAHAASMRCGADIVEVGDTEYQVLQKCGQPTYRNDNRWIYDRGPGNFVKIVVFGNARVLFIQEDKPFD